MHSAYNVVQHGQPKISLFAYFLMGGELCWAAPRQGVLGVQVKLSVTSIYLEMLAVHFALKTFRVHLEAKHATVMIEHMSTSHSSFLSS